EVRITCLSLFRLFHKMEGRCGTVSRPWHGQETVPQQDGRLFPAWAKALTVLLSLRPIMGDLQHGNVNLFILFLVIASLYSFHRGRDWRAGVVLGLAIACKVTPALFVPYFLWKRAWKTLAGCGLGLVLFFGVVPACFLGWQENAQQLRHWADGMVRPFVVHGIVTRQH